MAGRAKPDLRPGEEMLPTAQADASHARDASWNTGGSHSRLTGIGPLRAAEHRFYRASESDGPSWDSCARSSHVGDGTAGPTPVSSPGVVACVLPFCASTPITASSARA